MEAEIDVLSLRESLGWSQEALANYLGLDRSSVSRMENGQRPKGAVRKLLIQLRDAQAEQSQAPPSRFPRQAAEGRCSHEA
jgi:transcriptional regulator with XRE-family HTH domain